MADKDQNIEAPEHDLEKAFEGKKEKTKKIPVIEGKEGEIIEIEKAREKLKEKRKKPDGRTLEAQKDRTVEAFEKSAEEEEIDLEKQLISEELEQHGLRLLPEEIKTLQEAMPELVRGVSPEFAKYLDGLSPRLTKLMQHTEKLKAEKNEHEAVSEMSKFVENEFKLIDKIKDEKTKEQVITFIGSVIDIDKVIADMKKQTKVEGAADLAKIIPIVGPGIELGEAAAGKTVAGKKLTDGQRAKQAVVGAGFMALDVAGFFTAGTTAAASTAVKAARAGEGAKGAVQAGRAAYKTAKAAEAAKTTAMVAGKGYKVGKTMAKTGMQMGRTMTRMAALCRKTEKLKSVSASLYKVGKIIKKYPRLTGFLTAKLAAKRSAYKGVKKAIGASKDILKTAPKVEKRVQKVTSKTLKKAA